MRQNYGGEPAFPVNGPNGDHPGMTYRQWLIGQVAPTMLNCYLRLVAGEKASIKQWANWPDGVAGDAVAFADAIIRIIEREREMSK